MIKINLITVGKLKESYLRDAQAEYSKRLGAYCKLNIVELPESRLSDSPSEKEISSALSQEAKTMEKYLSLRDCTNIAMCIEGRQMTSPALAKKIETVSLSSSTINFIIGSSFGIDDTVKQRSSLKLSMSEMTFPHQLARIMLLEQIYRAFSITAGSKYHK